MLHISIRSTEKEEIEKLIKLLSPSVQYKQVRRERLVYVADLKLSTVAPAAPAALVTRLSLPEMVAKIEALRKQDHTLQEIADKLNEQNFVTPNYSRFYKMLISRVVAKYLA